MAVVLVKQSVVGVPVHTLRFPPGWVQNALWPTQALPHSVGSAGRQVFLRFPLAAVVQLKAVPAGVVAAAAEEQCHAAPTRWALPPRSFATEVALSPTEHHGVQAFGPWGSAPALLIAEKDPVIEHADQDACHLLATVHPVSPKGVARYQKPLALQHAHIKKAHVIGAGPSASTPTVYSSHGSVFLCVGFSEINRQVYLCVQPWVSVCRSGSCQ